MDNMYSLSFPTALGIGFDEMFNRLTGIAEAGQGNYPPYNIIDESETESIIEMAVAGFNEEDLDIEQDGNKLTISGNKDVKPDDSKYRHQGIAYRNFSRTFALADHIQVNGASVDAGILRVYLERIVPDELKAKKINIVSDRVLLTETSSKKSKKK
jgi:molecular chaperone IbpA